MSSTALERRLLKDLFAEYSSMVRPVEHVTQPTVVRLGTALQQIIDMVSQNRIPPISCLCYEFRLHYSNTSHMRSFSNVMFHGLFGFGHHA